MNNRKGLSLTEIIVSVLIITIMAAGVFGAFVGTEYIFNRARHRLQAFNFAREVQDKLRSNCGYNETDYPDMDFGTHPASNIGVSILGDMIPLVDPEKFTYKVFTYDEDEGSKVDGYKKVEVKVIWEETSF
ncbi:MAG: type II secretion system protein [Candidatus Omnitrophica bacterium]|nr:type II secretion system protein [Candidatus Omnitrophota bacterium]